MRMTGIWSSWWPFCIYEAAAGKLEDADYIQSALGRVPVLVAAMDEHSECGNALEDEVCAQACISKVLPPVTAAAVSSRFLSPIVL